MATIGEYIKERRTSIPGLTQPGLAERLKAYGVDRDWSTIAAWETDKNPVPIDVIPALALALEEKSTNKLYDLAGVVQNLTGSQIIRLLADADESDVQMLTEQIESHFKYKKK